MNRVSSNQQKHFYRFTFQGQEKDDELKGEGNSVNYKFRMHDPRVGRFFAVDPLTKEYPFYTPYSFSGNKVVGHIELEGLEETDAISFINPIRTSSKQSFSDGFQNGFASNFDLGNIEFINGSYVPTPKSFVNASPFGILAPWNIAESVSTRSQEFKEASGSYCAGYITEKVLEIAVLHKVTSLSSTPKPKVNTLENHVASVSIKIEHSAKIPEGKSGNHVFSTYKTKQGSGKFADTPKSRQFIEGLVNEENYIGTDNFGTNYYSKTSKNGNQLFVQTQKDNITSAGYNLKGHERDFNKIIDRKNEIKNNNE